MKPMIDLSTISQKRPSPEKMKMTAWQQKEFNEMALTMPFDSNNQGTYSEKVKLTQFKTKAEYGEAVVTALDLLEQYKSVPEPLRTKLVTEAKNIRKQGIISALIL